MACGETLGECHSSDQGKHYLPIQTKVTPPSIIIVCTDCLSRTSGRPHTHSHDHSLRETLGTGGLAWNSESNLFQKSTVNSTAVSTVSCQITS